MDLRTNYLGLDLPHPFMPGASVMSQDIDKLRRLEDAGAAAVVLHSLFEEQILQENHSTLHHLHLHGEAYGEALSYFPDPAAMAFGPAHYLRHLERAKAALSVPVLASLNCATDAGWRSFGRQAEEAGADGLELNFYFIPVELDVTGVSIERQLADIVADVKSAVSVPVAVKLSPFFSSMGQVARTLDAAGADGLVLFNRFYQPAIDLEERDIMPALHLSNSSELPLRLAWVGLLAGRVRASLAITGGVHTVADAVKAVMAGADGVQMVSALLSQGPAHLQAICQGVAAWLETHEYDSLAQMKGSMSYLRCPDPAAYTRANYMRAIHSWRE